MEIKIKIFKVVAFGILVILGLCHVPFAVKKTYIVHVDKSEILASFENHTQWYDSSLKSVSDSAEMLYTYTNVFHGFSTRLTAEEDEEIENQPGFFRLEEAKYELHKTRTHSFIGLNQNAPMLPESNSVSEVIVGVLDTGVWSKSKSFDDTGFGPIPSSWKGDCETGTNFIASTEPLKFQFISSTLCRFSRV